MNTGNKVLTFLVALAFSGPLHAQGNHKQTIDVVGQGMAGPVVSMNGATLIRTKNGLTASLTMPTPAPGSYHLSDS